VLPRLVRHGFDVESSLVGALVEAGVILDTPRSRGFRSVVKVLAKTSRWPLAADLTFPEIR
jgi:hypothetical protein